MEQIIETFIASQEAEYENYKMELGVGDWASEPETKQRYIDEFLRQLELLKQQVKELKSVQNE